MRETPQMMTEVFLITSLTKNINNKIISNHGRFFIATSKTKGFE